MILRNLIAADTFNRCTHSAPPITSKQPFLSEVMSGIKGKSGRKPGTKNKPRTAPFPRHPFRLTAFAFIGPDERIHRAKIGEPLLFLVKDSKAANALQRRILHPRNTKLTDISVTRGLWIPRTQGEPLAYHAVMAMVEHRYVAATPNAEG